MSLSVADNVEAGDQFVLAKGDSRQYRAASQKTMLTWIKTYFVSPDPVTQVFTPTDGATIPMAQNGTSTWLLIKPQGAIPSLNISFPSSEVAVDGQLVECSITYAVTTLAITSAGLTVSGAPTTIGNDGYFRMKFNAASNTWYMAGVLVPATPTPADPQDAAEVPLDPASLVVASATNVQDFADGVDHALLKDRGTGVSTSYVSTVAVGGTTFAQPEVFGEINSDQGYFDIHGTGATGITVNDLSASSTFVYYDNTGALRQQTTIPTRQDWSRKIFTMRIGVNTVTNTIIGFEYLNNPIGHYANSIRDIYDYLLAQGISFKKGQAISGRADLGFDVAAGSLLEFGGTGDINNPNIRPFDAVANTAYNLMSRTALVSSETNLVKFWDNAGTITALGSTTWVGHRVYRFSSSNFAIQYGQGNYANITLAKAGVPLESYAVNPALEDATFFGWWYLESTATTTNNIAVAEFVPYKIGI